MSVGYTLKAVPNFSSSCSFPVRPIFGVAKCSLVDFSTTNEHENFIKKIRERIGNGKVELSPSAYDTAWVAMVASREYSGNKQPRFPQCLDWIIENQNPDGSWGLNPGHPCLVKDSLSCTLACLLALRKWNVGHQLVQRGLDFIASNGWAAAASHNDQFSPIGFYIIFPAMVNYAKELDLTIPLTPTLVDSLLRIRELEIRKPNQECLAEGLGNSCNWRELILTHQRSDGSLFNSPATTAAALIHCPDDKCSEYLISVLKTCNGCVPTIYPTDIYTRLCMVDTLERLGINRYFETELGSVLDEIYSRWLEKEEEIFSNVTCQAMAFRLLRMKGYDVSSDELAEFVGQEHFFNTVSMQYRDITTVLELYRASQIRIYEEESTLEKIHAWTKAFLKQQVLNKSILDKRLQKQVEYDLKNFHGTLARIGNRRSIELYNGRDFQIVKTAFRCPTLHNEDFILFSMQDFRISQAQYQKELQQMLRWYAECRLDRLNQGRNILQISYMLTAALIVGPELSMARISYAQVVVLVTSLDDFFDHYGSIEEAFYIVELVSKWKPATAYCSQEVEILFTALYNTVNEVAAKGYAEQGHSVKYELLHMWLELLTNFLKEKDSWNHNNVSTLDEYLSFAWKSVACNICVLTSIKFYGIKLSEEMLTCTEFTSLVEHASLVCRLLNDLKTYKKEQEENALNSVNVLTAEEAISEEEAILKVEQIVEYHRRKVLQMVYQRKGSIVPRECKELFWKTCKIAHCLYSHDGGDEFTAPREIAKDMNALIWEPIEPPPLSR